MASVPGRGSTFTFTALFQAVRGQPSLEQGLVSQLAGYLAISYALGYLPASIVSPTLLGQPVLTALLAVPLLNESIGWAQVAGGALVLAGIWFINRPRTLPV